MSPERKGPDAMTHHPKRSRTGTIEQVRGFSVQAEPWAEGTVLALHGELDLDTVTDLHGRCGRRSTGAGCAPSGAESRCRTPSCTSWSGSR